MGELELNEITWKIWVASTQVLLVPRMAASAHVNMVVLDSRITQEIPAAYKAGSSPVPFE